MNHTSYAYLRGPESLAHTLPMHRRSFEIVKRLQGERGLRLFIVKTERSDRQSNNNKLKGMRQRGLRHPL